MLQVPVLDEVILQLKWTDDLHKLLFLKLMLIISNLGNVHLFEKGRRDREFDEQGEESSRDNTPVEISLVMVVDLWSMIYIGRIVCQIDVDLELAVFFLWLEVAEAFRIALFRL